MILSDLSIKRPVLAVVISLLLLLFGLVFLDRLPVREFPKVDIPQVSITTTYPGASAVIIESKITRPLEDSVAGIEGIDQITAKSQEGVSSITIQFKSNRNLDDAVSDVREKVISASRILPEDANSPSVSKASQDDQPILWLNLQNPNKSLLEISEFGDKYIADKFSTIDGVANVFLGGRQEKSLRIWLDSDKLYANGLTPNDIVRAVSSENIEVPSGSIDSSTKNFVILVDKGYQTVDDFAQLVIKQGSDGYLLRLGDVARIAVDAVESRTSLRGNGNPMVGVGIIKQSNANTLAVARAVKEKAAELNQVLTDGYSLQNSYDSSLFVEDSIDEVYFTLFIAVLLVILVVYTFLNDWRTTFFICLSMPTSIIATFIFLHLFGFSINILTLLAIVLAIGLVVDDAIVVHENIYRRVQKGEKPLDAAWQGSRQVAFAVVSTSIVLISVFLPITLIEGFVGKMFAEFAITIASAIFFSVIISLTLSPALCSRFLVKHKATPKVDALLMRLSDAYAVRLSQYVAHPKKIFIALFFIIIAIVFLFSFLKKEFVPGEDRGFIFSIINAPAGSSYAYTVKQVSMIEERLLPLVEAGHINRLILRVPGSFVGNQFNTAIGFIVLTPIDSGRPGVGPVLGDIYSRTSDISGADFIAFPPPAIARTFTNAGFEYVLQGPTYQSMLPIRDEIIKKLKQHPGFSRIQNDYKENTPQIKLKILRERIAEFGITVSDISATIRSLLTARVVTNYTEKGDQYDVIVEGELTKKTSPSDILNYYVRSPKTGALIPLSNLVSLEEFADATILNRYNRQRSITIGANLDDSFPISEAIDYMRDLSQSILPPNFFYEFKGSASDYIEGSSATYIFFLLSIVVIYLVLAAQFENLLYPMVILFTVPLAIFGGLLPLFLFFESINIYSQFGLIILMGICTKNGILLVEFANQLREKRGMNAYDAIMESCKIRLRPILMTNITAVAGTLPLILNGGSGSETRRLIGMLLFSGISIATLFTLFVIPTLYIYFTNKFPKASSLDRSHLAALH